MLSSLCGFETCTYSIQWGKEKCMRFHMPDYLELQIFFHGSGNWDDKTTELKRKHLEGFSCKIYSHYAKYPGNPNRDR